VSGPRKRGLASSLRERREAVASRDGTPIAVWRGGDGPPLVLVHGATADHNRWAPALPALEARFTVVTVDRRGRGRSGDAAEYAIEREFEDVAAVVEWAGEAVDLLGHSYGGMCALEAALRTDRIRRLVLYEPPLGFVHSPPDVVARMEALHAAGERDALLAFFLERVVGLPAAEIDALRALPSWAARLAAAPTLMREDRAQREYVFDPERFRAVAAPTLFLLGGDSAAHFGAAAEAVQAALPDCRTVVLPGQRHSAIDTATGLFTGEVLRFLEAG
jgi:pimeloyl-ACP methyl ester carboxylesterase